MSGAEMVTITLDGREIEVVGGELLIKVAEDNGTHIPRFCWHPRMRPVGMCRMCLVEVEGPRGTALVPSCMQPVHHGMIVHTESEVAKKAQEGVLEFLLINHPLDCPVCDKGGECPLQDQTMSYGPGESRFVEEKRHYEKPIPISDLVLLDRERCILCARCTQFADEIAGDALIEFQSRGNDTHILTFPDDPFNSYFSGNTVQICPVGALTASPYRFRARPWDLRRVESVSGYHTEGSRIAVHASQNRVLRFLGVDNGATNQGWLSDKERFGFEYLSSEDRLTVPLIRQGEAMREATWGEALDLVADRLGAIIDEFGGSSVAALGGARGTNEDAYALSKFMRVAVGSNHLDAQLGDGLSSQFLAGLTPRGTIDDLERAKTVLVWGPDLKETHPILYLRVRRAAQELGANLIVVHPRRTGLDDRATHKITYQPGTGAGLLQDMRTGEGRMEEIRLALDEGPVVAMVGRAGLAEDPRLAESVAAFARDLPGATILPLVHRGNTFGALDMGVAPDLLPGRVSTDDEVSVAQLATSWGPLPEARGLDAEGIAGAAGDEIKALILCGADPVRDLASGTGSTALENVEFSIAVDLFLTESSSQADVVFPALAFPEKEGTTTNLEGRVQKANKLIPGPGQARADWSVFDDVATRLGRPINLGSEASIAKEIAEVAPAYRGVSWDHLEWDAPEGAVVPIDGASQPLQYVPVDSADSTEPIEFTLHYARTLYDDGVALRQSLSLSHLAPGAHAHLHPTHASSLSVQDGDLVTVVAAGTSLELPVRVDPTLHEGTVYVPFNQPGVASLGSGLDVQVVKVDTGGDS